MSYLVEAGIVLSILGAAWAVTRALDERAERRKALLRSPLYHSILRLKKERNQV